jgi:aminoglycoside phosphotransferase (APT) family kinase protein
MPAEPIDEDDLHQRGTAVLSEVAPGSELGPLEPLHGGHSSLIYVATWSDPAASAREVVLKVAPAGLAPVRNRDVLRQARLQRALQGTGVPCPEVIAAHPGTPPELPPFYVMRFERGDCVEPSTGDHVPSDEVRPRELDAARILGILHSLDPEAIGLGDEPVVTPDQELQRWSKSFEACDEDLRIGHRAVLDLLVAALPAAERSVLIHGDFRLGNTLSAGDEVVSVIDWEIWARSDPRVDLAWFLMMCNPEPALGRTLVDGMPRNDELLEQYQGHRGVEVSGLAWFAGLVRYKQAAITALLIRNARRRQVEGLSTAAVTSLLAAAHQVLASG